MTFYKITNMYYSAPGIENNSSLQNYVIDVNLFSLFFSFVTDQELVLVFGFEHGRHLLQISAVTLLLQVRREEDGDDPLCDVGEVEVIVPLHHVLHHLICAFTPAGIIESGHLKSFIHNCLFDCKRGAFHYLVMELLFFCGVNLMEPCWGTTRITKQGRTAEYKMLRMFTNEFTHSPGPVQKYR